MGDNWFLILLLVSTLIIASSGWVLFYMDQLFTKFIIFIAYYLKIKHSQLIAKIIRLTNLRVGHLLEIWNETIYSSMIINVMLLKMCQQSPAFLTQTVLFKWGNCINLNSYKIGESWQIWLDYKSLHQKRPQANFSCKIGICMTT